MHRHKRTNGIVGSIREIIFGLEDSLVSTVGAVTGIAVGTQSAYVVILSGLVLVAVESVSMSAGSYLSSKAAMELNTHDHERPLRSGGVMLIAYLSGGTLPLLPYLFLPIPTAMILSIILTALALFAVGLWRGKVTRRSLVRSGVEMVTVSLSAALIGFLIGRAVSSWAGVQL